MLRLRLIAVVFGALALLGSCASEDEPPVEPEATAEATTEAAGTPDAAGGIEQARTVQVAETDLGEVLVNEDQLTLYLFMQDTGEESTCTGGCAQTWPALEADDPTAGDGVDGSKLSTNDDGQVVYNGHPLYTYSGDEEPGDTNGQGVGDNWYAVSPDGEAIEDE
jgi:predicted lipoprotein with Yx(FWY)xxD motif